MKASRSDVASPSRLFTTKMITLKEMLRGGGNSEEDRTCAGHAALALGYGGGTVDKKFYQDLLEQMSDGVYFVNLDRRIT